MTCSRRTAPLAPSTSITRTTPMTPATGSTSNRAAGGARGWPAGHGGPPVPVAFGPARAPCNLWEFGGAVWGVGRDLAGGVPVTAAWGPAAVHTTNAGAIGHG